MCPPLPGRNAEMLCDSVASSFENRSDTEMSESQQDIDEQFWDLPSFITPKQRRYVGKRVRKICAELEKDDRNRWHQLDFDNTQDLQKHFIKLAKNYFDGSTTAEAIKYYENLTLRQLDYICLIFSEFLIVTEGPDPITREYAKLFQP